MNAVLSNSIEIVTTFFFVFQQYIVAKGIVHELNSRDGWRFFIFLEGDGYEKDRFGAIYGIVITEHGLQFGKSGQGF